VILSNKAGSGGNYLEGGLEERMPGAFLVDDISDQQFLPIVGGQDRDLLGRVPNQDEVHVPEKDEWKGYLRGDNEFRFL
jgi:hypothetical protein